MAIDRVIFDTSALYALASNKDEFHSKAKLTFQELIDDKAELFIPSYVLVEAMFLIHRRLGYALLERFINSTKENFLILWVGKSVHSQAWNLFKEKQGKGLSFVDCTIVVQSRIMEANVFTFDEGLVREGLTTIPN